jgi:hypothetical protein
MMRAVLLTAALLFAGSANAFSGNNFLQLAELGGEDWVFYVMGVMEGHDTMTSKDASRGVAQPAFCLPRGVTRKQAAEVVRSYVQTRAKDRHHPASVLALLALREAWPCD